MTSDIADLDLSPDGPVVVEEWLGAAARSYPRRPGNVLAVLERAVRRWPDAVAFVSPDGTTTTYAGFERRVEQAAAALLGTGLRPGDAVAVADRNSLDLATAIFGCARAGLVMVGLNTRLAPTQWTYMLSNSEVRLTLASQDYLGALPEARLLGEVLSDSGPDSAYEPAELPAPAEDAAYAVVYTSGTTGRPKASQVVHRCSVHSAMSYQKVLGLRPGERAAVLFPLYYISAMHAHVLPAMLAGATCVLVDTSSPRNYVETLHREDISWAYAVPSWWLLCTRLPAFRRSYLPRLDRLAAGGAVFPPPLVAALRERLPGTRLLDIYGLSETHSPATMLLDAEFAAKPGSVGRPLPCMEAEVRDGEGRALPPGTAGELHLRGSLVTTGYAGDPRATSDAIRDGWFRTGDVARIDADGFVFVLDRVKDMINRGGNKVFSAEVEALLRAHPDIEDAAVVAVPDAIAGEAVAAYVVLRPGCALAAAEIRGWVRDGMADYAAPRDVHVLDALPHNAVGKTDKVALRAGTSST